MLPFEDRSVLELAVVIYFSSGSGLACTKAQNMRGKGVVQSQKAIRLKRVSLSLIVPFSHYRLLRWRLRPEVLRHPARHSDLDR